MIRPRIFFFSTLIILLVCIKLIRLIPLPGMELLWNFHVLFFASFSLLIATHFLNFFRSEIDKVIFVLILFLVTTLLYADPANFIKNYVIYIMPITSYYLFRNYDFSILDVYRLFSILSVFLLVFFFIDFYSNNVFKLGIFDYSQFHSVSADLGRVVSDLQDKKSSFLFSEKILRVAGVSFNPQSSAVIYAAFSIYHLILYRINRKKLNIFLLLAHIIVILLFSSATSILVFLVLFVFQFRSFKLNGLMFISFPPMLYILLIFHYGNSNTVFQTLVTVYNGLITIYIDPLVSLNSFYFHSLFFGTGANDSENLILLNYEIDFINIIFQLGIINVFILSYLIYKIKILTNTLWRSNINVFPIYYIMLGVILGSIHYQSIFKYPGSILLFGIIGLIVKQHMRLQKTIKK